MLQVDIVRAWKDEEYRLSLPLEVRETIPPSPVGPFELSDQEMTAVVGGDTFDINCSTIGFWCSQTINGNGHCGQVTDCMNSCPTHVCNTPQTQCS